MKKLIIFSAFLLALSSCTKEMPVPDSDPDSVYVADPDPNPYDDPYSDPDPYDDPSSDPDNGGDDPGSSCTVHYPAGHHAVR